MHSAIETYRIELNIQFTKIVLFILSYIIYIIVILVLKFHCHYTKFYTYWYLSILVYYTCMFTYNKLHFYFSFPEKRTDSGKLLNLRLDIKQLFLCFSDLSE